MVSIWILINTNFLKLLKRISGYDGFNKVKVLEFMHNKILLKYFKYVLTIVSDLLPNSNWCMFRATLSDICSTMARTTCKRGASWCYLSQKLPGRPRRTSIWRRTRTPLVCCSRNECWPRQPRWFASRIWCTKDSWTCNRWQKPDRIWRCTTTWRLAIKLRCWAETICWVIHVPSWLHCGKLS